MKATQKRLVDLSKVNVDPNMKSHKSDPFVVKKVEEAKQALEKLRKAGINFF
jgi:hypothetical protein